MSLAIKFGDNEDPSQISGFIYFDAVTTYSKQMDGKVTSHPLDAGASITDHYVSENTKYNISGVISSADISGVPLNIILENERPFNVNPTVTPVQVRDAGVGSISSIVGLVSSIFRDKIPEPTVERTARTDYKEQVDKLISGLMTGLLYDEKAKKLKNRMTLITLYGFKGSVLSTEADNLVMTSFNIEEDQDSGNGLYFTMTLEHVSFVSLEKTELPKDVSSALTKKAPSTSNKSKADSTAKPITDKITDAVGPSVEKTAREMNDAAVAAGKKILGR